MRLVLEKRPERSNTIALVSPLIAIGLTITTMIILFAILGKNPFMALWVYFIDPLTDGYSLLVYPTDRSAYSRLCRLLSLGKKRAGKAKC